MSSNEKMMKGMKDLMKKGLGKKSTKPGSKVKDLDLSMFDNLPKKAAGGMMKKKGYKMGGMTKKGYQAGGVTKKTKKNPMKGGLMDAIAQVDKEQKKSKPKPKTDRQLMQMRGGGMAKKGMARGGMTKKGMARGGMTKKGYKKGGKVRGVGIASKGFRPAKMVSMSKGGKKGGKK
jgi:hypothetical protein